MALRGYLTTYVNFCWGLGQLIGIGVIKSMLGREDEWAYRMYVKSPMYRRPKTDCDEVRMHCSGCGHHS